MKKIGLETLEIRNTKDGGYEILYSPNNRNGNTLLAHKPVINPITQEQTTIAQGQLFEEKGRVILVPAKYTNIRSFQENYLLENWIFQDDPYFVAKRSMILGETVEASKSGRITQDQIDKFNKIQNERLNGSNNNRSKNTISREEINNNLNRNNNKGGYYANNNYRNNTRSAHPANFDQNTEYVPKVHMDKVVASVKSKYDKLLDEVSSKLDDVTGDIYQLKKDIKNHK